MNGLLNYAMMPGQANTQMGMQQAYGRPEYTNWRALYGGPGQYMPGGMHQPALQNILMQRANQPAPNSPEAMAAPYAQWAAEQLRQVAPDSPHLPQQQQQQMQVDPMARWVNHFMGYGY